MATEEFNEDSIDTETLQAQIDLSMSFAQNLISSWMEPAQLPTSTRRKDLEKELMENMKRPPRLGVGASAVVATQSLGRETARLKSKLTGSKRTREEVDEGHGTTALSDAEDESRTGAISKKARPDPFGGVHGKKKKKANEGPSSTAKPELSVQTTPPATALRNIKPSTPVVEIKLESGHEESKISTTEKKKKKRKCLPEPLFSQELSLTRSPLAIVPAQGKDELPSLQIASKPMTSSPKQRSTTSTLSTELCSPDVVAAHLLDLPLLNLNGPPPSDGESDAPNHSPIASPKKKRKRRKKKKTLPIADSTEGVANSSNTAQ
ncbi:hypothetical protein CPB83DRAFT_923874 [Crepidotus variabilis]|uniref:Uncharacterized protein n=1 Tax=Crepidotus variabilis TaxID=179855 RepID=A0A9P6ERF8_9AGAR|nr:hypothetical protein CPB83DRAFT_923874 [Crepidotus variabilis]